MWVLFQHIESGGLQVRTSISCSAVVFAHNVRLFIFIDDIGFKICMIEVSTCLLCQSCCFFFLNIYITAFLLYDAALGWTHRVYRWFSAGCTCYCNYSGFFKVFVRTVCCKDHTYTSL